MALYVVTYPRFAAADSDWIEAIRQAHDPQAALIAAHVTLVFAAQDVAMNSAAEHLHVIARAARFPVTFEAAVLRPGPTEASFYAYLLPTAGADALVDLHDALHAGPFAGHQVLPFEPHVTMGRSTQRDAMAKLVERINDRPFIIEAEIEDLHLLEVNAAGVSVLATAALG